MYESMFMYTLEYSGWQADRLVPVFDNTVPSGAGYLTSLMRVPQHTDTNVLVSFEFGIELSRFPIPNVKFTIRVS